MLRCRNCGLGIPGWNRGIRDGEIVDICFRCGYAQPTLPRIFASSDQVQGEDSFGHVEYLVTKIYSSPAVKKLLADFGTDESFLRSLVFSGTSYLPANVPAAFKPKAHIMFNSNYFLHESDWGYWEPRILHELTHCLEYAGMGKDEMLARTPPIGINDLDAWDKSKAEISADVAAVRQLLADGKVEDVKRYLSNDAPWRRNLIMSLVKETDPGTVISSKELELAVKYAGMWDVLKGALTSMAPAIATIGVFDLAVAYETFKKVLENSLAAQSRTHLDPRFSGVKTAGFLPEEDFDSSEVILLSFSGMFDLVKTLAPVCAKYALDTGDDKPLRGIGKLVGVMRQFSAENRSAVDRYPSEYDRLESDYSYTPGNSAQKDVFK